MLPSAFQGTHYVEFLAKLVVSRSVKRYLEIGVNQGDLFSKITVQKAIGVDPTFVLNKNVVQGKNAALLVQETSDQFFEDNNRIVSFFGGEIDLSFLDGMHRFEYLLRDFYNTERFSSKESMIVMHDCLPIDGNMIDRDQQIANTLTLRADRNHGWWTGDVWKMIPILKKFRPDLRMDFLDCHPTGLVCVSKLDPHSKILSSEYSYILEEFMTKPNTVLELELMYQSISISSPSDFLAFTS